MADPKKHHNRARDVEALAASLFVALFPGARGSRTPDRVAQESFEAARAFYRAADAPDVPPAPTTDQTPPG